MAFHFRSAKGERVLPRATQESPASEQVISIVSKLSPAAPRTTSRGPSGAAAAPSASAAAGSLRPRSATMGGAGPRPKTGSALQRPVSRAASVERVLAGMEAELGGPRRPRPLPQPQRKAGTLPPIPSPPPHGPAPSPARPPRGSRAAAPLLVQHSPPRPLHDPARRRHVRCARPPRPPRPACSPSRPPAPQPGALQEGSGLLQLPTDLLERIMASLPLVDLLSLERTCAFLRAAVDDAMPRACVCVEVDASLVAREGPALSAALRGLAAAVSPSAESFEIVGLDLAGPRTVAAAAALTRTFAAARRWPELRRLSGAAATSEDLRAVALACPALLAPVPRPRRPGGAGLRLASPTSTPSSAAPRRPSSRPRRPRAGRPRPEGEPELTDVRALASVHGACLTALHLREDSVAPPPPRRPPLRLPPLPHRAPPPPLLPGRLRRRRRRLRRLGRAGGDGPGTVAGADLAAFVTGGGPAGAACASSTWARRLGLPRTLGGPSRTPFHLVQLLARAPRLRRLRASLEGGGDGSEAGPHWLSEHCSHLEALEVRRACNVSPEDIAVYLSRARAVRRLHLSINVQGAAAVRSYHASFALLSSLRPDVKVTRSALATGSASPPPPSASTPAPCRSPRPSLPCAASLPARR
eukprot:tig00021037_g17425.t1